MGTPVDNLEKLVASVTDIADTKIELAKLRIAAKISASLSSFVTIIMVAIFSGSALIILSFGLAYYIGNRLNNLSYGFFIVGGFYTVICLLMYLNRRNLLQTPFINLFIKKIINGQGY
jgi:hypothetical protein